MEIYSTEENEKSGLKRIIWIVVDSVWINPQSDIN